MSDTETSTTPAADAWMARHRTDYGTADRPDVTVRLPQSVPYATLQTANAGTFHEPNEVLPKLGQPFANLRLGGVLFVGPLDDLRQMLAAAVEALELVSAYAVELGHQPAEVVR